jgi:hypothetical protein
MYREYLCENESVVHEEEFLDVEKGLRLGTADNDVLV